MTVDQIVGNYVAPSVGRAAIGPLRDPGIARQASSSPSVIRDYESAQRVHVESVWGLVKVGKIDRTTVEDWAAGFHQSGTVVH